MNYINDYINEFINNYSSSDVVNEMNDKYKEFHINNINSLKCGLGLTSGYLAPNLGIVLLILYVIINYEEGNDYFNIYDYEKYYLNGYFIGLFMKIYNIKLIIVGVISGLLLKKSNLINDKIDLEKIKNIIVNINNYANNKESNSK